MTSSLRVVYGRDKLQKIVESNESTLLTTLAVQIDEATEDLEKLIAIVSVAKAAASYIHTNEEIIEQNE